MDCVCFYANSFEQLMPSVFMGIDTDTWSPLEIECKDTKINLGGKKQTYSS